MNNNLINLRSRVLSLQVTRALEIKAQRGDFPGRPPIGYINDTNTKRIIPDIKSWQIIKEAMEKYASGKYTVGWIALYLNNHLPSVQNCERRPLSKTQVEAILRNKFYTGEFTYRGKRYLGKHKPMISKITFDKNQALLDKTNTRQ